MQKYAVELGQDLGIPLTIIANKRGFNLTTLIRFLLWQYLDSTKGREQLKQAKTQGLFLGVLYTGLGECIGV